MDIYTVDHLPSAEEPYTLPRKHTQWIHDKLEMLEKAGMFS